MGDQNRSPFFYPETIFATVDQKLRTAGDTALSSSAISCSYDSQGSIQGRSIRSGPVRGLCLCSSGGIGAGLHILLVRALGERCEVSEISPASRSLMFWILEETPYSVGSLPWSEGEVPSLVRTIKKYLADSLRKSLRYPDWRLSRLDWWYFFAPVFPAVFLRG
jgi:hypothetical protein